MREIGLEDLEDGYIDVIQTVFIQERLALIGLIVQFLLGALVAVIVLTVILPKVGLPNLCDKAYSEMNTKSRTIPFVLAQGEGASSCWPTYLCLVDAL